MTELNRTELYILKGLLTFSDYCSKYIDKVQPSSFCPEVGPIIKGIKKYYTKYDKAPSVEILCDHALPKLFAGDKDLIEYATDVIIEAKELNFDKENYYDFLVDETQSFIQRTAIENALMEALPLVENGEMDAAVALINQANSLNFDDNLGHDYFEDLAERVERMKTGEDLILTGMSELDRQIGGGWHKKSLNIFGAATNVGKTLILSDIAMKLLAQGKNGLYISLEIYEDLLANRIDANLSDIALGELADDPDQMMRVLLQMKQEAEDKGKPFGRLIIKESAPGCLSANGIKTLIRELELKRGGFKPDFLMVDYIGLMVPNSSSFSDNTYGKLKTVAEELRAVGSVFDIPVFSAVQVNRDAFNSSHVGLENTSDSMGIPMTADLMIMITRPEDSEIMKWHIAKSRFSKNGQSIEVGVTYDRMRLRCVGDDEINTEDDLVRSANRAKMNLRKQSHLDKKAAVETNTYSKKPEPSKTNTAKHKKDVII